MAYSISIQEHVALAVSFRRSCGLFPTGLSDEQQQAFVKETAALAKPELILGTQKVQ